MSSAVSKKRILIVAEWINLSGGVTRTLLELLKQLDPREFETTLYVLRPEQSDLSAIPAHTQVIENGFDLPYMGARRTFLRLMNQQKFFDLLGYLLAVAKWKMGGGRSAYTRFFVKRHPTISGDFDVAAAYAMLDSYSNQLVAERAEAKRKIMWCHTDTALYKDRALAGLGEVLVRFDVINCVSRDVLASMYRQFPELNGRLRVRHNLMDENKIKHLAAEPIPHPFPTNVIVLATVARISPEKGIDLLVETAERLRDSGHRFVWWVVGPDFNHEFASEVKARCKNSGLEEFVRFVGGQENPYPYMASCDIYVQPSRVEGFCTTTAEAKILGVPVICTNTPGADEQFENRINGSIVDPAVDCLFEEIVRLIESPAVRQSYREVLQNRSASSEVSASAFIE